MAAFDDWRSKRPLGYKKALRESIKAVRNYIRLEKEIAETPTETIEGMRAKIRCAQLWGYRGLLGSITGGCEEAMALSIFNDIIRMTDAASSRPAGSRWRAGSYGTKFRFVGYKANRHLCLF